MTQAELNTGRVKMGDIREVSRQEFLDLLDQLTGTKVLVWDQALTGPMGLVAEYSILKEHEVLLSKNHRDPTSLIIFRSSRCFPFRLAPSLT